MLVLSRKVGQRIVIPECNLGITVVAIEGWVLTQEPLVQVPLLFPAMHDCPLARQIPPTQHPPELQLFSAQQA